MFRCEVSVGSRLKLLLATVIASSITTVGAADCVSVPIPAAQAIAHADLVFLGRIARVETANAPSFTQKLTLEVEESWKGETGKTQLVYHSVSVESRVFGAGERFVMFAKQLKPSERGRVGLSMDGPPAFFYLSFDCGGTGGVVDLDQELRRRPSVKPH